MKKVLSFIVLVFCFYLAYGQEGCSASQCVYTPYCGPCEQPQFEYCSGLVRIPINLVILRKDDCTDGLDVADFAANLVSVNQLYEQSRIQFYQKRVVEICDSDLYNYTGSDLQELVDELNNNDIGVRGVIVVSVGTFDFFNLTRGTGYLPGGDPLAIVLDNQIQNGGATLAHEIGHIFGLLHTHNDEDGCTSEGDCGDLSCITDDLIIDTETTSQDPVLCSNRTNIMSYPTLFGGDQRSIFSLCQVQKVHDVLTSCRESLCSSPAPPTVYTSGLNLNFQIGETIEVFGLVDGFNGTNTQNCLKWSYETGNSTVELPGMSDHLTLTTGPGGDLSGIGSFLICAIDESPHSSACRSASSCIEIQIESNNSCSIAQNCLQYQPTCNNDDTYNLSVTFDGDDAIDYTINAYRPDGSIFATIPNAEPGGNSQENEIEQVPITEVLDIVVEETNNPVCVDQATVTFFPDVTLDEREECESELTFLDVRIDDSGAFDNYIVADGIVEQMISANGIAVFGPYPPATVLTVTIYDPQGECSLEVRTITTSSCTAVATPARFPTVIRSPVKGIVHVSASGGENCSGNRTTEEYCFNQWGVPDADGNNGGNTVCPGTHWIPGDAFIDSEGNELPSVSCDPYFNITTTLGGIGGADDTYAWDANLDNNAENGEPVYAIEDGEVVSWGISNLGQLLLKHRLPDGTVYYSGYLHMNVNSYSPGDCVQAGEEIGTISNVGTGFVHLHFAIYEDVNEDENVLELVSRDAEIRSNTIQPNFGIAGLAGRAENPTDVNIYFSIPDQFDDAGITQVENVRIGDALITNPTKMVQSAGDRLYYFVIDDIPAGQYVDNLLYDLSFDIPNTPDNLRAYGNNMIHFVGEHPTAFNDTDADDQATCYIDRGTAEGIFRGSGRDPLFFPDNPLTRGQAAKVVTDVALKAGVIDELDTDTNVNGAFPDVDECEEFFPYIQTLKNLGHVSGDANTGEYRSGHPVTYAEFAKILVNALDLENLSLPETADLNAHMPYPIVNESGDATLIQYMEVLESKILFYDIDCTFPDGLNESLESLLTHARFDETTAGNLSYIVEGDGVIYRKDMAILLTKVYQALLTVGNSSARDEDLTRNPGPADVSNYTIIGSKLALPPLASGTAPSTIVSDLTMFDNETREWDGPETDADGNLLAYYWTIDGGTLDMISPNDFTAVRFTPPVVAQPTVFRMYSWVGDTEGNVAQAFIDITVIPAGSCPPSSDIMVTEVTTTSAVVSWTNIEDGNTIATYTVEVSTDNSTWNTAATGITGTLYTINGLSEGQTYYVRVVGECTDASLSPASLPANFVARAANGGVVGECPDDEDDDDEDPVFLNCPTTNYTFSIGNADDCTVSVNWSIPVAIDNCDVSVSQLSGPSAGSNLGEGVYGVIYLAQDNNGNAASCAFTVQVIDNQTLQFTNCPTQSLIFGTDPDACDVYANWSIPVAVDNCEVTVTHQSGPQPGDQLSPGIYNVVYEATNNGDPQESATCSFFVQVNETQNPELNCPQDVFVESDPGVCEAVVDNIQLEFAFDNCPYTVTWTSSPADVTGTGTSTTDDASGAIFPVGVTTVIYTITENDDFGNGTVVASCDLIVTVTDTEPPVIVCPNSVVIGTNDDGAGNYDCATDYGWAHPTPTDNCAVTVYQLTYTNPDGTTEGPIDVLGQEGMSVNRNFAIGVTTILYHVEDAEGNITECTWTVEVIDDEDPMIFCEDVVATNVYTYPGPLDLWPEDVVTATITVVPSMTITDLNIPVLAGTQGDMGNLSVTLTSPEGTTISLFDGLCTGTADFNMSLDDATATGIAAGPCGPLGGGMMYTPTNALSAFNGENSAGDWVLTFTNNSVDVCGYLNDWQLEIIGNDVGPDVNRLQVIADEGTCTYTMFDTDFDPPFTDNCPEAFITHDYEFGPFENTLEGSVFELGETTIEWTATDAAGNTTSCTLVVEVLDTEAPQFINCDRPDIILNPLPGTCESFANFSLPLAIDNCGEPTVTQTDATGLNTGEMFPVGTTILTWQATDAAGNTEACEIRVIVNDSHPVVATGDGCPDDIDTVTDPGDCGKVINDIAPAFMDSNCPDNLSIIYRIDEVGGEEWASGFFDASGTFFELGAHAVQYRAQDQPLLLISEVTHDIQAPLGGNDIIPPYMTARALPDEDFLEITNFGPASLDIGGLDIERIHATGRDTFRVPALEILAPGEVFVLHFGHDYDSPADHYYNVHCAPNLSATDGAAYILSHSGRVLDVAAINGFDPIGQGVAGVVTVADWSGGLSGNDAGIRRISVWDDNEANDFIPAFVCGEITIGQFNPDLTFAPDNGSLTALQARLPNKLECSFNVTITDNELPVCGSYEPYESFVFDTPTTINAGDCFEATVNVASDYLLADVNTALQAASGDLANLTVKLISPEGTELVLSDGICVGSNGWDLTYDSDSIMRPFVQTACALLNAGEVLRPVNDLNLFNKRPSQGTWTLQMAHNATVSNDPVVFTSWELLISELIPYQQGDATIENDFRECGADFTWLHTGIWDNCPGGQLNITYTFEDGTVQGTGPITRQEYGLPITRFFDVGVTTVTYGMTDSNGNGSSCSFDVTVLDTEPPQLSCPSDTTLYLAGRECDIIYVPTDWYTMDNCAVTDTIVSPPWELPLPIGVNVVTLTVLDEAGNPTVCEYEVTVVEYVPVDPIMSCIGDLNVSLGPECSVEITAAMVLSGTNYHCIEDYEVTLLTGPGPDGEVIPGSPFLDETYAGQTVVYSVYDPDFDITCWGYIHVELYEEPEFECPADIAVNCLSDTSPATTGEPVLLSCALGGATVTHEDVVQEFGACDDPRVLITRTWTVADAYGNSSTCVQTITIEAFDVADITFPPDYNNLELPALNCAEVLDDPSLTHPDSTGYPTLNGSTDVFLPNYCNASFLYEDQIFNTCPGSYEIVRTWQVRNTCLPYDLGVNPRVHVQIIQVFDTDGPDVVCPPDEIVSTGPFDCTATYQVPAPEVLDACSATSYTVTATQGNLSLIDGTYYLSNLPEGPTTIEYRVVDECVGVSLCSYTITVQDLIEPTAACNDELNVSIGGGDIAAGISGSARIFATDVNEGSGDNCTPVNEVIRRNYWQGDGCADAADSWSEWGEYVDFLCCDVGKEITIELFVTDENGNSNSCWMTVIPEDKLNPYCTAPADVELPCTDLPLTFPGDIMAAYEEDFAATSLMMTDLFGGPSGTDNCRVDTLVERSPQINLNECGWGTITRRFEAWQLEVAGDINGNGAIDINEVLRSTNNCSQEIVITEVHDFVIDFPEDAEADCGEPNIPTIITESPGCDVLSINIGEPAIFAATGDECYKLSITYDVINWCLWDGAYTGYELPRITEDDGEALPVDRAVEGNERPVVHYSSADGLRIDRNHTDRNGDSSIPDASPAMPNYGRYIYTQFVKVYDSSTPVITVGDYGGPTDLCPDLLPEQFGDTDGDCMAEVNIPFTVADECELFDGAGNLVVSIISVELDAFAVDANGDGQIDANEFLADDDASSNLTDNGDGTYAFTGTFPIITDAMGDNIVHAFRVLLEDGCGNQVSEYMEFDVIDCKGPAPICINGLTVTLMPQQDGDCAMTIWASDFEGSPIYDCTGQGPDVDADGRARVTTYAIYRASDVEAAGDNFMPHPSNTGLVLTSDDDPTTVIYIYAFDEEGNYDYCETYVLVQQHASCDPTSMATIAGTILTEESEAVENVSVNLNGEMSMSTTTAVDGYYQFPNLMAGGDYSVTPYLNSDPLNGVSTFDIILISKHVLGTQLLDSPYKLIAADVNRSNTITTLDLIQIRKLILNINTEFSNNTSWRFVGSSYVFPQPTNPWMEEFPELHNENDLLGEVLNADFVGVKIGDVNGSAQANALSSEERSLNGRFNLWMEDMQLLAGNQYTIDIYGEDLRSWAGFQGTLVWNDVSLLDVTGGLLGEENLGRRFWDDGFLTLSWNQPPNKEEGKLPLFGLHLLAHQDMLLSEAVRISDRFTRAEAYQADAGRLAELGLAFGGAMTQKDEFELYQNIPNPFIEQTLLSFYLPEASEVTLEVRDVTGRILFSETVNYSAGYHTRHLDSKLLLKSSGVLSYSLRAGEFFASKKMVLLGE